MHTADRIDHTRALERIMARDTAYTARTRAAVENIAGWLGADACHLLVYHHDQNQLVLEATWGLEQDAVGDVRLPPNEGITGLCFRTGEVVNISDMRTHPEYAAFNSVRAGEYSSLLTLPLVADEQTLGVLAVSTRAADIFPEAAVKTARDLAGALARGLQKNVPAEGTSAPGHAAPVAAQPLQVYSGIPVTDGVARGRVCRLAGPECLEALVPDYTANATAEKTLLLQAIERAREDTAALQQECRMLLTETDTAIFAAHLMLLEDAGLRQRLEAALDRGCYLRYALKVVLTELEQEWRLVSSSATCDCMADVRDVIFRIYQSADAIESRRAGTAPAPARLTAGERPVVVAQDILPSQLVRLPLARLAGIVCAEGGLTSHTAVLAKALRIPMLIGVKGVLQNAADGAEAILDCPGECLLVNPSPGLVRRYEPILSHRRQWRHGAPPAEHAGACTRDGLEVRLSCNISLISELPLLQHYRGQGIGLYRTEFMCMMRRAYPTEEEQYAVFRQAVEAAGAEGVTVRLFDLGWDKSPPYMTFRPEVNPALGLRGWRYLVAHPDYLTPHIRSILRAAAAGTASILIPMVTDVEDVLEARAAIEREAATLRHEGVAIGERCPLGVMLEVPAAFFCLGQILPHIDAVRIGTNDLVQYLFAADRGNDQATRWYHQFHPVLLKLIHDTCATVAAFPGRSVAVCGEMASRPLAAPLLIGAGIRHLSMNPWCIPQLQRAISRLTLQRCEDLYRQAVALTRERDVLELLSRFAAQHGLALPAAAGE